MEEDGNSGSGSLRSSETAINVDDNLGSVDPEAAPNSNFSYGNGHTSCEPDIDSLRKEKGGTQEEIRECSRQSSPDPDVPEETPAMDNGMRDSSNELEAGHGVDTDSANTSLPLAQEYDFIWGSKDGNSFSQLITWAYAEVAHWRRNLFTVPTGNIGKEFVRETTRLLDAFNQKSRLEPIAFYAVMTAPALLSQRPHRKSTTKENIACLERRLETWRSGDIMSLFDEGQAIQKYMPVSTHVTPDQECHSRKFAKFVHDGKIKAALRMLDESADQRGVLPLDQETQGQTVRDILKKKHPDAQPATPDILMPEEASQPHPVIFDNITGEAIRRAAMRVQGGAGPSGLDAGDWRRLCVSFGTVSDDLCRAMADLAKRLCAEDVSQESVQPYTACRLVPLDKNPGVRPIGICEVIRRIIGKAVLGVIGDDIRQATGCAQLCAGQPGGIEAAIHAMRESYQDDDTEAVLMVDASNAFNCLNRQAALHNIEQLCPPFATILRNTYGSSSNLFVGGECLLSREGTTQGDPLAMGMYAVGIIPLIRELQGNGGKQLWYADDASDAGSLKQIRSWWDVLRTRGPSYGYFPNATKSWLLVKENVVQQARALFEDSGINITIEGRRLLGAALGTEAFVTSFIAGSVT